ncbi:hypothetical protein [Pseudomonas sp. Bi70]|uniref:hypothetical protein n=1 Tax=Pseudomonas sp. Bi70 TaxID=2821127 RepID=UPI001E6338D3|nr:hypothetical protein [Pseudomonas sp. Bi70]
MSIPFYGGHSMIGKIPVTKPEQPTYLLAMPVSTAISCNSLRQAAVRSANALMTVSYVSVMAFHLDR